jgi:hypothetical protein
MYGGCDYTVAIYENKGKGDLKYIAECSACTRAHKGEPSEVFTALLAAGKIRPAVIKRLGKSASDGYYFWRMREDGLNIQELQGV